MASDDTRPVPGLLYTIEELVELVRVSLRYARSLPPREQRDEHRRVAKSLRALCRSRNWVIERASTAPIRSFDRAELKGLSASEYRAYFVGADGDFAGSRALNVNNDTAAIESAKKMLDGKDLEIWCGARKIIRLPHK